MDETEVTTETTDVPTETPVAVETSAEPTETVVVTADVPTEVPVVPEGLTYGGKKIVSFNGPDIEGWYTVIDEASVTYKLRKNENGELVS